MKKRSSLMLLMAGMVCVWACRNDSQPIVPTDSASAQRVTATSAGSFDGVNWADARDNYVDGWIIPSGIDHTKTAAEIASTADAILGQFQSKLSANSVRLGINPQTVSDATWWPKYKAIINKATSKGMKVILGCWDGKAAKDGIINNLTQFNQMWDTVLSDYGSNGNVYFEIFNEPFGYSDADWKNVAAGWINRQAGKIAGSDRSRILVGGTGYSEWVSRVGGDSRFNGCLFSQHIYPYWRSYTTESQWKQELANRVGAYANRTVVTEYGAVMAGRASNYYSVFPRDGDRDRSFMTGVPNKIRETNMGSVYWPGLRDGDSYSLTTRSGSGTATVLTITNSSGKDQVWWSYNK